VVGASIRPDYRPTAPAEKGAITTSLTSCPLGGDGAQTAADAAPLRRVRQAMTVR